MLTQFLLTASERELYYHYQKVNIRVSSRLAKQLKSDDLMKLQKLTKLRKISCETFYSKPSVT